MNKTTLLILAAGMGSRYGGLKQMDAVGPNGESIIDYSVYDAIQAGFKKVVFVIRKAFEEEFKQKVSNKFRDAIEVVHVYQSLDTGFKSLPCPTERNKPWGTGHAILVTRSSIQEPFAVINADDYYGQDAFIQAQSFLSGLNDGGLAAMVGYPLINTLSEHGFVNRGVCELDENYFLNHVIECEKIRTTEHGILYGDKESGKISLQPDVIVSMNFWLFHSDIFEELEQAFFAFLEQKRLINKAEFYIPSFVDEQIRSELLQVLVLSSDDSWYGVTYKEDKANVVQAMKSFHESGRYPTPLTFNKA
jgi:UTP-glucose-1-phosphate uridylyltransferase